MTAVAQAIVSEDRPRFAALIITAAGNVLRLEQIETLETEKSDNGDAGTWSITAPLAINTAISGAIGPMDLVALYANRGSTDSLGQSTSSASALPDIVNASHPLAYGSANAQTTRSLGTTQCLMIGMIDSVEEAIDYESAHMELSIHGRDLTKVFIDNDTLVPETLPEGGGSGSLGGLSNIVIKRLSSGTQLLLDVLDVFVSKNPNLVSSLLAAGQSAPLNSGEASVLAQYGYPWRNFVRADLLITGFQHLASGQFQNFSVQNGSAWVNATELRNFPITRLYVNEVGALVFDDTWTAWGFGSDTGALVKDDGSGRTGVLTLNRADVRKADFRQSDENVVTALSITAASMTAGDTAMAGMVTFGKQNVSPTVVLKRYGYRYVPFASQYDPTDAFVKTASGADTTNPATNVLQARFPLLWTLHNNLWSATFTIKGNAQWRVGQRLITDLGGSQAATQPPPGGSKQWYIMNVRHSLQWGSDWVTTLQCRFPQDYPPSASPTLGGTGSGAIAASGG